MSNGENGLRNDMLEETCVANEGNLNCLNEIILIQMRLNKYAGFSFVSKSAQTPRPD